MIKKKLVRTGAVDKLNSLIARQWEYLSRHYYSGNLWQRFLWRLLGLRVFENIVYDVFDCAYHTGVARYKKMWMGIKNRYSDEVKKKIGSEQTELKTFLSIIEEMEATFPEI